MGFIPPPKTQWAYQPEIWKTPSDFLMQGKVLSGTELGALVSLHHDANGAEFSISRVDNTAALKFTFTDFTGSFLSLAIALPEAGVRGLGKNDLLRIAISANNTPFQAYARLNLLHGPNTEQITRTIDIGGDSFTEFDVCYTDFDPKRAKSVWIDVIINSPSNSVFTLENVTLLRRPRASL